MLDGKQTMNCDTDTRVCNASDERRASRSVIVAQDIALPSLRKDTFYRLEITSSLYSYNKHLKLK